MVHAGSPYRHPSGGDASIPLRSGWWLAAALGIVLVGSSACGGQRAFNVLVLIPDTVRADHLSINGYVRETSPHIDALARDGTNFTQAITVAPRTWQSIVSMLTGLYPPHHGVRYIYDDPLRPDLPTLASVLHDRGYTTAAFDTSAFLKQMTGGTGFDLYGIASRREDGLTLRLVSDWVHREREDLFAAVVRLQGAHWPYGAGDGTTPFEACEDRDHGFNEGAPGLARRRGEGFVLADETAQRDFMWSTDIAPETLTHMIAHYDAGILAVDALIGRLVEEMRVSGLLEQTIVVVVSDHGESFGERGYLQHGPRVDEGVVRVPLVIRLPETHPAYRPGREVDGQVRTVDIFPTVLDALGFVPPAQLDGISLLPAMRGEPLPDLWAYGESGRSFVGLDGERLFPGIKGKQRMIRTRDWKLLASLRPEGWSYRLHDLGTDPGEERNLAEEHKPTLDLLRGHLETVLASEAPEVRESAPTHEELELLRELGYAQ